MYYVVGGRFKDRRFRELMAGSGEQYGPFASYEAAFEEWRARMFAKIDDYHFRLFVTENPDSVVPELKRA